MYTQAQAHFIHCQAVSNHVGRGTCGVGYSLSISVGRVPRILIHPIFFIYASNYHHNAPAHSLPIPHAEQKYLIFGKNGWIGGKLIDMLKEQGKTVVLGQSRLENREALFAELDEVKPTHVLDAAGVTGRPNIDWCETHQVETIRTNVIGTLNLAEGCHLKGIHMTLYATGCIFEQGGGGGEGGEGGSSELERILRGLAQEEDREEGREEGVWRGLSREEERRLLHSLPCDVLAYTPRLGQRREGGRGGGIEEAGAMMDVIEVEDEEEEEKEGGREEGGERGLRSLSLSRRAIFLGPDAGAVLLLPESAWWDEEEGGRRRKSAQELVSQLLLSHTASLREGVEEEGGRERQIKEGWVEGWADAVAMDEEEEDKWDGGGQEMALSVRLDQ
eukprot:evm.model.NODE_27191_length_32237_cov_31.285324.4